MGVVFKTYPNIIENPNFECVRRSRTHSKFELLLNFRLDASFVRGNIEENGTLQQTQFAGTRDGFGAALNLQFVKNLAVVPFDRIQGQEKPLADLSIR
jgi:hypothetical protein